MKHIAVFALILIGGFSLSAQNSPNDINTEELQEKMEESLSDIQTILDTLDFNQLFSQDFNKLFENNFGQFESLDSLGSFDINQFFGEDMMQMFGDIMPQDFEADDFQKMMEESMKMLEQIDISELQGMFEGMDFNFEGLEDLMKDGDQNDSDDSDKEGDKKKKRKIKKI